MSKEAQYVPELTWEQKGKLSSRPPKWSQEDHEHVHQPESLEQGPSPAGMRPKGGQGVVRGALRGFPSPRPSACGPVSVSLCRAWAPGPERAWLWQSQLHGPQG